MKCDNKEYCSLMQSDYSICLQAKRECDFIGIYNFICLLHQNIYFKKFVSRNYSTYFDFCTKVQDYKI